MVVMSAEVTKQIKQMTEGLVKSGLYKSQSEVVRDAIRQLAYKYGSSSASLEEVRRITAKATKKSGETLADAVRKMREEV